MQKKGSLLQVNTVENVDDVKDIFGAAGVGAWAIEMENGKEPRLYYDHVAMHFMGMDPNRSPEEQYKIWLAGVLPSAMASVNASVDEMMKQGQSENTYPWIHPERGLIYIRCGGALDRSYTAGIRLRGYHQDVTENILELERQKLSLQAQNARIDAFSSIYFAAWEVDLEKNRILPFREPAYVEEGFQRSEGDAKAAIAIFIQDYVCAPYQDMLQQLLDIPQLAETLKRQSVVSVEYKGMTNGWCRLVIVPERRTKDGTVTHVLAGIQGIALEKKKELEARANQSILLALCEEYLYVYYVDLDQDTYEIKKFMGEEKREEILDTDVYSEAVKKYAERYVKGEYRRTFLEKAGREGLMRYLQEHKAVSIKYEIEPDEENRSNFMMTIVKVADSQRDHMAIIGIRCVDDVVQQENENKRQLEAALTEAKRANAAKSMFLSRMSHDIRTPLNGIIGLIELNERHSDDKELIEENYKKAKVAAHHLLSLLNDVLEISKLDDQNVSLAHEPFNILELAAEVLTISEMRAAEAGVTLEHGDCKQKLTDPYVYGSPLHVRQIFLNILDNAIKYNKPGGSVSCSAGLERVETGKVIYKCTISDTGIGMSEEFLKHIYEPFAQEHYDKQSVYQGTGLGMPIVKSLVDKMNGTIEIQSREGEGSTFIVTIPFEVAQETAVYQTGRNQAKADITGMRILLVEDNELNMEIATYLLKDAGAVVYSVWDGEQAVEAFQSHPAGTYDVILMDVMMPVMDGLTATRTIRGLEREDAATIPIIAMTANAFAEDVQMVRDAGMNAHLAKPLDAKLVIQTIAGYVDHLLT